MVNVGENGADNRTKYDRPVQTPLDTEDRQDRQGQKYAENTMGRS